MFRTHLCYRKTGTTDQMAISINKS